MSNRSRWTRLRNLVAGAVLATAITPAAAQAEKYASIVIDAETDTVLHARHADAPRHPASLTKVMTLYMVFEELKAGRLSLDEALPVSAHAARQQPSNLRLRRGDTITVRDAIDALITKSANDVAVVVAERIGGTEARFAALMTVKARTLGLTQTSFYNASGLHDYRQVTTARDMARLAEVMLEEQGAYYDYFATQRFSWDGRTYRNHNRLLGEVEGVDGIKTGYTRASGFNLMAAAERDNRRIIAVMLGGHSSRARNDHVEDLIEAAYESVPEMAPRGGMKTQIAFDAVRQPVAPDAAAVPMLNGKPFVPVGEGDVQ